jgi:exodeoxyribonuclease V gamma subunit
MQTHPRRGDRDTRNEDRYLFLEALMAARQALHISFIGEDVGDGSRRNPAAPLAELLEFIDEQTGATNDEQRPWLIRHPLQPFDRRYYTSDQTRLFSFDRTYEIDDAATPHKQPFVDRALESAQTETRDITLKSLHHFWRNPSRATLRDGFGIGLDALGDDALIDDEPLTPALERRERYETQLLDRAWRDRVWEVPSTPPAWLAHSGALPAGDIGSRAYMRLRARVQPMLDAMRRLLGDDAERISLPVDVELGDARLVGLVDRVYRSANGALHLLYTKPDNTADFRDLIPFYIDYAALRLSGIAVTPSFLECADKKGVRTPDLVAPIAAQDIAQLRKGLSDLIRLPRDAARSPLFFFPKTSWCWTNASDDKRDADARKAWEGAGPRGKGERDYEPGYAALVARDSDFLRHASPRHDDFVATNRWVASILDPHNAQLLRSGTRGDA